MENQFFKQKRSQVIKTQKDKKLLEKKKKRNKGRNIKIYHGNNDRSRIWRYWNPNGNRNPGSYDYDKINNLFEQIKERQLSLDELDKILTEKHSGWKKLAHPDKKFSVKDYFKKCLEPTYIKDAEYCLYLCNTFDF
ncbi:unnamed protein product [Blepharisma stoltei]|uniref:Uncharacterized protein n=1 Tax=Blepharisma stoltei TaxID=1481888 RepID=A0AAU9ITR9_9CILI|nr:unnamed protein product [Blepharisma stoltei]